MVVPSVNYEVAPPLVIMEAFRQKTPALVKNIGSMPEIIEDSDGGFVFNDSDDLRVKIDQLCASRTYRDELGMRGYSAYREKWTADAHFACYLAMIREIFASRNISID